MIIIIVAQLSLAPLLFFRHDIAEVAGLVGMSFGQEGVDRYIIVYKKEHTPCEDEVRARRNGAEWTFETAKEYAEEVSFLSSYPPPNHIHFIFAARTTKTY